MTIYYPPTQNAIQKTLDAQLLKGITASMTLNNVVGIANKPGVCVVDFVDTNNKETPTKREYIAFTGVSGNTLTGLTRNADGGGTDQDHSVGAIVQFPSDILQQKAIIDTFTVEHGQDGKHTSAVVTTLKATGAEITTGTEDAKIVTPKAIADSKVVITDKTQTLTNKTLTSPVINYTSSNITTTARASIYLGSNQSIAKDSYVKINLNTESYDSGNNFDNVTNYEFTCPVNGYYLICGQITFENNTTGTRIVAIGVNGTENIRNWNGATLSNNYCTVNISNVKYITSGTKITLLGYQSSGGNLNILGSVYHTFLDIHLLSV